jgi:hypothetical protein
MRKGFPYSVIAASFRCHCKISYHFENPQRFAQEALGNASAAIHRAYAKSVRVELPPLEEYERDKSKVVALPKAA